MKSRNYESRNNELSRYNEVKADDAVMQVSIEKSRYNELSRNNEVKGADGAPSLLRDFTVKGADGAPSLLRDFTVHKIPTEVQPLALGGLINRCLLYCVSWNPICGVHKSLHLLWSTWRGTLCERMTVCPLITAFEHSERDYILWHVLFNWKETLLCANWGGNNKKPRRWKIRVRIFSPL